MKKKYYLKLIIFFFSILLLTSQSFLIAKEQKKREVQRESFVLTVWGTYMKMISPKSSDGRISLIIHNHTLSDIRAKILDQKGQVVREIAVSRKSSRSYQFAFLEWEGVNLKKSYSSLEENKLKHFLTFMPITPGLQDFPIKLGMLPYEIP